MGQRDPRLDMRYPRYGEYRSPHQHSCPVAYIRRAMWRKKQSLLPVQPLGEDSCTFCRKCRKSSRLGSFQQRKRKSKGMCCNRCQQIQFRVSKSVYENILSKAVDYISCPCGCEGSQAPCGVCCCVRSADGHTGIRDSGRRSCTIAPHGCGRPIIHLHLICPYRTLSTLGSSGAIRAG